MQVITKFDLGDVTNEGPVFSWIAEMSYKGELNIRYWTSSGKKWFTETELDWPGKFCKNCGGKVVPTVYEGHPDWTHDTGDGTTSFLCHARNIAEVDA